MCHGLVCSFKSVFAGMRFYTDVQVCQGCLTLSKHAHHKFEVFMTFLKGLTYSGWFPYISKGCILISVCILLVLPWLILSCCFFSTFQGAVCVVFPSFSVYIIVFRQSPAVSVSTLFSFFLWYDLQCSLDFLSLCVLFLCIADYIYLSPYFVVWIS